MYLYALKGTQGSWTYITSISLVAILRMLFLWSAAGVNRKKIEFEVFLQIPTKIALFPNQKILLQKLIGWNVELDEEKK